MLEFNLSSIAKGNVVHTKDLLGNKRIVDISDELREAIRDFKLMLNEMPNTRVSVGIKNWFLNEYVTSDGVALNKTFLFEPSLSSWGNEFGSNECTVMVGSTDGDLMGHDHGLQFKIEQMITRRISDKLKREIPANTLRELVFLHGLGFYRKADMLYSVGSDYEINLNHIQLKDLMYLDRISIYENKAAHKYGLNHEKHGIPIHAIYFDYRVPKIVNKDGLLLAYYECGESITKYTTDRVRVLGNLERHGFANMSIRMANGGKFYDYEDHNTVNVGMGVNHKIGLGVHKVHFGLDDKFVNDTGSAFKDVLVYDFVKESIDVVTSQDGGFITFDVETLRRNHTNPLRGLMRDLNKIYTTLKLVEVEYKGKKVYVFEHQLQNVTRHLLNTKVVNVNGYKIYAFSDEAVENFKKLSESEINILKNRNPYNYKREELRFLKEDADGDNPLYMGVELEIDHGGTSSVNAEILGSALTDYKPYVLVKHDGSLYKGQEVVTVPATLRAHLNNDNFKYMRFFEVAKSLGYTGSNNDTAGMHIHVSKDFFKHPEFAYAIMLHFVDSNWRHVVKIARRDTNRFCRRVDVPKLTRHNLNEDITLAKLQGFVSDLHDIYEEYMGHGKYSAINYNYDAPTIEFRFFKSTLNYVEYMATLEFVDALCRIANELSIKYAEMLNGVEIKGELLKEIRHLTLKRITDLDSVKYLNMMLANPNEYDCDKIYKENGGNE